MTDDGDAVGIRNLMKMFASDAFVLQRTHENVNGPPPCWSEEQFWYVMIGCLLTTQQKSTTGRPVSRFLSTEPFPLSLSACRANPGHEFVLRTLTNFGGIRRTFTVAWQAKENLEWLEHGGWTKVEEWFRRLLPQREREPRPADKAAERDAARFIDAQLAGFGPKQSRNLWQWLRLTRYEIPLDSRVAKRVNEILSFHMDKDKLIDSRYYESCLDRLQAACASADVLPCIFDAAAFDDQDKLYRTRATCH